MKTKGSTTRKKVLRNKVSGGGIARCDHSKNSEHSELFFPQIEKNLF